MATYNGSIYIEQQLESILLQLSNSDEVILVDDNSIDSTLNLVKSFNDPRIKIYKNKSNEGILSSFEKAIKLALGEVVFLSDQDDIWLPGKVNRFKKIFEENADVTLILSDAKVIDAEGTVTSDSFFGKRGVFSAGVLSNIIKNKFIGCTMAFRNSTAHFFLPIPRDIPMHDMWIGCMSAIYGRVYFIDEPLIAYRRHLSNASPGNRKGIFKMIHWRWVLIRRLLFRVLSRKFKNNRD
jgi:glycosyltransferase involved in cell wall biosynthesis